jgi:hypothetical protein
MKYRLLKVATTLSRSKAAEAKIKSCAPILLPEDSNFAQSLA